MKKYLNTNSIEFIGVSEITDINDFNGMQLSLTNDIEIDLTTSYSGELDVIIYTNGYTLKIKPQKGTSVRGGTFFGSSEKISLKKKKKSKLFKITSEVLSLSLPSSDSISNASTIYINGTNSDTITNGIKFKEAIDKINNQEPLDIFYDDINITYIIDEGVLIPTDLDNIENFVFNNGLFDDLLNNNIKIEFLGEDYILNEDFFQIISSLVTEPGVYTITNIRVSKEIIKNLIINGDFNLNEEIIISNPITIKGIVKSNLNINLNIKNNVRIENIDLGGIVIITESFDFEFINGSYGIISNIFNNISDVIIDNKSNNLNILSNILIKNSNPNNIELGFIFINNGTKLNIENSSYNETVISNLTNNNENSIINIKNSLLASNTLIGIDAESICDLKLYNCIIENNNLVLLQDIIDNSLYNIDLFLSGNTFTETPNNLSIKLYNTVINDIMYSKINKNSTTIR